MATSRGNTGLSMRTPSWDTTTANQQSPANALYASANAQDLLPSTCPRIEFEPSPTNGQQPDPLSSPTTDTNCTEVVCYRTRSLRSPAMSNVRANTQRSGRASLTPSSLATAEEERRRQHMGTMSEDRSEAPDPGLPEAAGVEDVLPGDADTSAAAGPADESGVPDTCSSTQALSNEDWGRGFWQRFESGDDFVQNVTSWASKVTDAALPQVADLEAWHQFDAEWDPVAADLVRPPEAPEVHRDMCRLEDEEMELRRAMQTSNSVSKLLATPWQDEPDDSTGGGPADLKTLDLPSGICHIRLADERDAESISRIYNEEAQKGTQVPDKVLLTSDEARELIKEHRTQNMPVVVASFEAPGAEAPGAEAPRSAELVHGFGALTVCYWKDFQTGIRDPEGQCALKVHVFVDCLFRQRGIGGGLLNYIISTSSEWGMFAPDAGAPPVNLAGQWAALAKHSQTLVVDVVHGHDGGLAEQQYKRVLEGAFGFHMLAHPLTEIHTTTDGREHHATFMRRFLLHLKPFEALPVWQAPVGASTSPGVFKARDDPSTMTQPGQDRSWDRPPAPKAGPTAAFARKTDRDGTPPMPPSPSVRAPDTAPFW